MTKISAVAFSLAVVFQQAEAFAFIATRSLASPATVTFAQKPHRESAFGRDIDLAKANDMADHFGKYSLEEVEQMRRGMCLDRAFVIAMIACSDDFCTILMFLSFLNRTAHG